MGPRALLAAIAVGLLSACAVAGAEADATASPRVEPAIGETGGMCGGVAGFACAVRGDFCKSEAGACVNAADYAGVCTARPEMCTARYKPVCGCDGETYSNACVAASKGASVAYEGRCEEAG